MDRLNHEGYCDPTAADALANVTREEKAWRPCVFICSPFGGDVTRNTEKARRYMCFAIWKNVIPFAPHLLYPQVLEEDDPTQRALGLFFGTVWLGKCAELWVFGGRISEGMEREIACARKRRIPIRYFTEDCEEVSHDE